MRLTDADVIKQSSSDIHIYDRYRELKRVFVVRTYNITTGHLVSFIVHFDPDNPSPIMRYYLDVHGRKSWNEIAAHAKKCISMYGHFDVEDDNFYVVGLLVTDRIDEYIERR